MQSWPLSNSLSYDQDSQGLTTQLECCFVLQMACRHITCNYKCIVYISDGMNILWFYARQFILMKNINYSRNITHLFNKNYNLTYNYSVQMLSLPPRQSTVDLWNNIYKQMTLLLNWSGLETKILEHLPSGRVTFKLHFKFKFKFI